MVTHCSQFHSLWIGGDFGTCPLVELSFVNLWLKGIADAFILSGLGFLLYTIIRSWHYVEFDYRQRVINYLALGTIYLFVYGILNYLFAALIVQDDKLNELFLKLIPLTLFIALLVFFIQLLIIHDRIKGDGKYNYSSEDDDGETSLNLTDNQSDISEQEDGQVDEVLERIAVKSGRKIDVIMVPDIIYIQSDGDYVQIVTAESRYIKEGTMKYFEANLPRNNFVRVHRSYIVNVEKILRIELYEKQSQILTLSNGAKIKVSASGYRALRSILDL